MNPRHGLIVEERCCTCGPLLGQVPEAVALLCSPGGEGGRLAQFDHFDVRRGAVVILLELGDEMILGADDGGSALGELVHEAL